MSRYVAGTRFQHITVHGMTIPHTAFDDGFDTGDILVCDETETNGHPRFLAVIARNATEADVTEVGTLVSVRDFDKMDAVAIPALGVTVDKTFGYSLHDGVASFPDGSGVARPWDGREIPVEMPVAI